MSSLTSQEFAIDTSYFTSNVAPGGQGGHRWFCNVQENTGVTSGTVVRSIRVWTHQGRYLRGLRVEMTDGTTRNIGQQSDDASATFYIEQGEFITSAKLWSNDFHGGRCGGLQITTSLGHTFTCNTRPSSNVDM